MKKIPKAIITLIIGYAINLLSSILPIPFVSPLISSVGDIIIFVSLIILIVKLFKNEKVKNKVKEKLCLSNKNYYPSFYLIVIIEYIISIAVAVCTIGFIEQWDLTAGTIIGLILLNMVFGLLYAYLYFLPYLIANKRNHIQKRAIYILNIFAGWTIIAWIISLIWALTVPKENVIVQQTVATSDADELKKYKELLDQNVITQEEFDNKKKQLLGL